jgi:D-alanyl-D-alanine carboxypeptidase (penicillin-binding protein 5/6)
VIARGRSRRVALRLLVAGLAGVTAVTGASDVTGVHAGAHAGAAAPYPPAALLDPYPGAARAYLVAIDDAPRWAHAADQALPPASLVKLLTALVLLEDRGLPTELVAVTAAAAATEPTRAGLRAGDVLDGEQALAAMLVHSANDACVALVAHAAPDTASFVARLNARAAALGMRASHFADPCGYDAPGQYSTASDLLRLARAARAEPLIARYAAQPMLEFRTRSGRRYRLANTNQLLGRLPGTVGLKTGYTRAARQCLIALAERGGRRVWLVMLGGEQRWWLAHRMISDAFDAADVTAH